jgi:stress response protein YsnF
VQKQEITMQQLSGMQGAPVYDDASDRIGSVEEIFYDTQSNQPAWIGIGTGFLGTKRVLVPVEGARAEADGVYVPYSKDKVKDSPDIDSDEISAETEDELYAYYGVGGGVTAGAPSGAGQDEATVTRSEEELRVGTRTTDAGQARLRKWVETEPVSEDVELKRESARVTREPIDQPVSGAEIGEEQVDVTLRAEEPVVEKQAVAKERIGVEKDVDVDRETVTGEVRKERVEVEGEADERR